MRRKLVVKVKPEIDSRQLQELVTFYDAEMTIGTRPGDMGVWWAPCVCMKCDCNEFAPLIMVDYFGDKVEEFIKGMTQLGADDIDVMNEPDRVRVWFARCAKCLSGTWVEMEVV